MIKKIIDSLLVCLFLTMPVCAIDLDYTVDDVIRKNYGVDTKIINPSSNPISNPPVTKPNPNPNQVQKPKITPTQNTAANQKTTVKTSIKQTTTNKKINNIIPLRKNSEIEILNINQITDKQRAGTNIVFVSKYPIRTPYYTFPQGTKFVGRITNSHTPQFTGNGGLVSLEIITIIAGGEYQHIDSHITRVGDKRVFYDNIKGQRCYLKNTVEKGKWGRNTFHKTNALSKSLAKDKTTAILSPFTFIYGVGTGTISTAISPIVSIFSKGKNVCIPQNTTFKIKLDKDAKIKI